MAIKKPEQKNESTNEIVDESKKMKSETFAIDEHENVQENVQVDFVDEELGNAFASKQTKPNRDAPKIDENKTVDEIKNEIHEYEESKSGKLTHKDLLRQAEFFINMFDTGTASLFSFISRDKHYSDYKLLASDKKLLSEQLAIILAKYQDKFKIEYTFLMGLIIMYAPVTMKAFQKRKENKTEKMREDRKIALEEKKIILEQKKQPDHPSYKHDEKTIIQPKEKEIVQPLNEIEIPNASTQEIETTNVSLKPKRGKYNKQK